MITGQRKKVTHALSSMIYFYTQGVFLGRRHVMFPSFLLNLQIFFGRAELARFFLYVYHSQNKCAARDEKFSQNKVHVLKARKRVGLLPAVVPEHIPAEDAGLVLEPAEPGPEWGHVPLGHVEGGVHNGLVALLGGLL